MTDTGFNSENTKILHGIENTISYGVRHLQNATEKLDLVQIKMGRPLLLNWMFTKIITLKQEIEE